jgi:predicted alpha/beta hydrolase family esterase
VPVLLLQGWLGSGPGHWQRHWLWLRPHWQLVDFGSWEQPDPRGWRQALAQAIAACERPPC